MDDMTVVQEASPKILQVIFAKKKNTEVGSRRKKSCKEVVCLFHNPNQIKIDGENIGERINGSLFFFFPLISQAQ